MDRDEFNRMADVIRDDAKKLFAEHCAKDYATASLEERLMAEIHVMLLFQYIREPQNFSANA